MSDAELYSPAFFDRIRERADRSAAHVVPIVLDHLGSVQSVVDYGCGDGAWLQAFANAGVPEVVGVDGDHVDRSRLLIPAASFVPMDLRTPTTVRSEPFDLATCLEVAEHLPADAGPALVDALTASAPAVLFGAAVPGQAGQGHVNLRWQSYWAELFGQRGFEANDVVRPAVWDNDEVAWFYAQNTILYRSGTGSSSHLPLSIAHPMLVDRLANRPRPSGPRAAVHALLGTFRRGRA